MKKHEMRGLFDVGVLTLFRLTKNSSCCWSHFLVHIFSIGIHNNCFSLYWWTIESHQIFFRCFFIPHCKFKRLKSLLDLKILASTMLALSNIHRSSDEGDFRVIVRILRVPKVTEFRLKIVSLISTHLFFLIISIVTTVLPHSIIWFNIHFSSNPNKSSCLI